VRRGYCAGSLSGQATPTPSFGPATLALVLRPPVTLQRPAGPVSRARMHAEFFARVTDDLD
jgi:hypothetical protein